MSDHDHGAVRQITDGLVLVLAFLDEDQFDVVAHIENGAHGVRELVEVEHHQTLELGDPAEIAVVGEEPGIQ